MRVHSVPQRLGALTDRAPLIPAGSRAMAAVAARETGAALDHVEVPTTDAAPDPSSTRPAHHDVLVASRAAQDAALDAVGGPVLTVGGDCSVELAPVARLRAEHGDGLAVLWFDAHPDLNTPATSPSGAYHGMVLRSLLGEGADGLVADPPVDRDRVLLVDCRAPDDGERQALDAGLGRVVPDVDAALASLGAPAAVYVHVDVDVLDPGAFAGLNYPEPDGWSVQRLVDGLDALAALPVVGAGITECIGGADEVETLAPVVAALGRLLAR